MALYYLESSALVKLYVLEPGTEHVLRLTRNLSENRFVVLALSAVEARSAVRRRERAGDIDPKTAALILARLQDDLSSKFLRQAVNDTVLDGALEMVDRYALRAYDAVQLAGCLALKATSHTGAPIFVCSDRALLDAARSELIEVFDPCGP